MIFLISFFLLKRKSWYCCSLNSNKEVNNGAQIIGNAINQRKLIKNSLKSSMLFPVVSIYCFAKYELRTDSSFVIVLILTELISFSKMFNIKGNTFGFATIES